MTNYRLDGLLSIPENGNTMPMAGPWTYPVLYHISTVKYLLGGEVVTA